MQKKKKRPLSLRDISGDAGCLVRGGKNASMLRSQARKSAPPVLKKIAEREGGGGGGGGLRHIFFLHKGGGVFSL